MSEQKTTREEIDGWGFPLFVYANKGGRMALRELVRAFQDGRLVVPSYQRGRVWTREQKQAWVGYVLSQAPLPAIFIREVNTADGFRDELVDGQQRLTSIIEWLDGDFEAIIPWSGVLARCDTDMTRLAILRLATACVTLPVGTTDAQAMTLYLAINSAGTQHTPEELARVRGMVEALGGAA